MSRTTDTDGALFEQLRPRLKAISSRIVGSEAEAEEVVQDCFLKWHSAERDALVTPAAWLTTVVQHQSIDHLRKRARDAVAAQVAKELAPDVLPLSPEEELLRCADVEAAFARMLARLSFSERLALVLHEVFECGHADIAAVLGTKAENARQYLARARKRLKQADDDMPPEEKLSRELIRRFQLAINTRDVPAVVTLLTDGQPLAVCLQQQRPRVRGFSACANDASYAVAA